MQAFTLNFENSPFSRKENFQNLALANNYFTIKDLLRALNKSLTMHMGSKKYFDKV